MMQSGLDWAFLLLLAVAVSSVSVVTRKLTTGGGILGALLVVVLFAGLGWMGFFLLGTFFVLGTLATAYGKKRKRQLYSESIQRTAGQVFANGGVGAACGFAAYFLPQQYMLFALLSAAAFSSATADTLSSELGSLFGKRFYDVLTFRNGTRGADGVISFEGLVIGIVGSAVVAFVLATRIQQWSLFPLVVIAGTVGNLVDSLLGAIWERRGMLTNNGVNFLNTASAALVAWAGYLLEFH